MHKKMRMEKRQNRSISDHCSWNLEKKNVVNEKNETFEFDKIYIY